MLKVGEDFDDVVLGMSIGSLAPVTQNLAAADPRFAAMLEHADDRRHPSAAGVDDHDARGARPDQGP